MKHYIKPSTVNVKILHKGLILSGSKEDDKEKEYEFGDFDPAFPPSGDENEEEW